MNLSLTEEARLFVAHAGPGKDVVRGYTLSRFRPGGMGHTRRLTSWKPQ